MTSQLLIVTDDEVERLLPVRDSIPIAEAALGALADGRALTAARHNLATGLGAEREAVLKVWAAMLPDADVSAVRITPAVLAVQHYGERAVGEPIPAAHGDRYTGLIVIFSIRTAEPLGILHDGHLSRLGTSIPVGIAARYLARPDSTIIGVLGTGAQARQQLDAVTVGRSVEEVRVFAPRRKDAERFADDMRERLGLSIAPCCEPRLAVDGCHVVIAATSATGPVIEAEWVNPGTHVSVTRPSEAPDALLGGQARIFSVGTAPAVTLTTGTAGALWHARLAATRRLEHRVHSLGDLISGTVAGRTSREDVTLFGPFVGQPPGVLWPALGHEVLDRARASGAGRPVPVEWFLQGTPS